MLYVCMVARCTAADPRFLNVAQAAAAAAVASRRHALGSVLFCMSLNHKQMSLYYAPAFFGHLFGCCLQKDSWRGKVGRQPRASRLR